MEKTKIGIIGCGNIVDQYLKACPTFDILDVVACTDILMDRAQAKAAEYGVKAVELEDLLADPDIQIIINLTVPAVHADVSLKVIEAGKSIKGTAHHGRGLLPYR